MDGSGNSNDGTLTNSATRSTDIPGVVSNVNSLDLTQDPNALVSIGDPSELEITSGDDLTIAAWVKPSATATIDNIFTRRQDTCGAIGYQVQLDTANQLTFTDGTAERVSGLTVPDGVWSFVAVVFDDAALTVDFFVNGSSSLNVTAAALGSPGGTVDVQIGQAKLCPDADHFDGLIDDVRVYDVALTGTEIAQLSTGFPGTVAKTLQDGPRIDNGSGVLIDLAGLTTGSHDAGPIDIGRTDSQFYEYKIEITNEGENDALDDVIVFDVIPAEYDLDPLCGDDPVDGTTSCDAVGIGTFVDRLGDNFADGIINNTPTKCAVSTSTSGGGKKKLGAGLEPEFITIELTEVLDLDDTCSVTVFVVTEANPGRGNDLFEPTGCRELDSGIFDTIALNDGLKVFEPVTGDRLLGPVESLQLTPNNCP